MTKRKRLWVALWSAVAIGTIILLAAGLSRLELAPGHPLPRREQTEELAELFFGTGPGNEIVAFLLMVAYVIFLLLIPFAIIYFIVSPEARKRVMKSLGFLMWFLALYLLIRTRPEFLQGFQRQALPSSAPANLEAPVVEFVANPPPWAVLLTAAGLAVLIAAGLVGGLVFIWRRGRLLESPLAQLAEEAQGALDALQAGADLKDTVLRCYFEMGRVLRVQQGIRREGDMTPREFERYLAEAGLPEQPVGQLTRLFENVRYGAKIAGEREERQAIDCLTAIVEACKGSP